MKRSVHAINGISAAIVAVFFTQVLHEAVHFIAALAVGAEVRAFNLFAVHIILFQQAQYLFKDIIIEASASIANIIIGLVAMAAFTWIKKAKPMWKIFLMQTTGYSLLMGFGYFLFDGLFYSPSAAGDWKSVIRMLEGSILLRVVLIIIGACGMVFTFFWLARHVLIFSRDKCDKKSRFEAAFPVLLLPYIVTSILYVFLSLWHPLGLPDGFMIVFFQFVFGFSGLLWAFFLSVYWLKPNSKDDRYIAFDQKINIPWAAAALLLLIIQITVLLPTIYL